MSSYVTDYRELLKVASQEFNDTIENGNSANFFDKLRAKNYYNYLGRYYYNKSLQNEYYNRIIVVPKNGYITQRLVYLNDDLVGGTKVGVQAINITEQDGDINLQDVGAVGFCPLGRFFDSLCYAFGIVVDKNKINIYELCNSVLQNFEFVYNRETGLHISINSANFNDVHVLYIVEDEKTYFDEDLVQAFANAMYNAGWFDKELIVNSIPDTGTHIITKIDEISSADFYYAVKNNPSNNEFNISYDLNLFNNILSRVKNEYPDEIPFCLQLSFLTSNDNINYYYRSYRILTVPKTVIGNSYSFLTRGSNESKDYYWSEVSFSNMHQIVGVREEDKSFIGTVDETIGGYCYKRYDISGSRLASGYDLTYYLTVGTVNRQDTYVGKDGITIIDGASIPTDLDSLSDDYPNWFSRLKNIVGTAVETAGEVLRNVFKVIEFVPLTLIGEKPTEPDNPDVPLSQDTTQTGVVLSPTVIGTLPEYTVKYLTPLPDTDTPISPDVPYVPIEDYTPSTPDEKYPWNSNPDTPIGNPIANPSNPPAIGGVTPSIPDNPIVNASNGLFTVYNPTMEQLNQFGGYLWGEDIVGILQSIFQNPIDGVISLHILYATPETGAEVPIKVGYLTSSVSAKKVVEQYINIDCGTVNIPEYYGNVLDYSPYTKAHIYLPFIGIREINVNEIMGGQVNVNYKVDVLTGSVYASISVFHNAISQVLYVFEGNGGVQLPLTGGNMSRILSGVVTGIAFGALTGGPAGAVVGGGAGLLKGASVSKSGSVSSNAGAMGIKYPYIMITHSQAYMANNYNTQYGYPSNLTTQLSACKGYTRVKEVHVENILVATQEEKDMIQTLLRQGVIIE